MFRARPNHIRPSEVSAKVHRPITQHDPGNIVPRSAKPNVHATPRTTKAREPGTSLAAAQPFAYHGRCIRPSRERTSHVRPRNIGQISPPTTPADRESIRPDRSDSATTRLSGRSSRTTVPTPRSTRSPFEAQLYFQARLNPKPPLERPSTIYIGFLASCEKRAALVFRFPTLSFIAIMFSSSLCVFALIMSE
ncbi:unnamed protein product [Microthlaspi erraticum]|uniref:Uncharacterized protein n=1 Tax=Microthlaspi erraticum TaxID=1685480 RepID=A0A6D2JET0_9BRAS|nr:unnamed protein product [Microthlaspi erraticum]